MQTYRPRNRLSYTCWLEINPWTPEDEAQRIAMCRGGIIGAWGQMETLLSELAIRASWLDEYRPFKDSFPYTIEGRTKFMRRVLSGSGPLQRFKGPGLKLVNRFSDGLDLRNLLAHARLQVLPAWGATFEQIVMQKEGTLSLQTRRFTLPQLEHLARRATRLSRISQRAKVTIDESGVLPAIHQLANWTAATVAQSDERSAAG